MNTLNTARFPDVRLRRLRRTPALRRMTADFDLTASRFIQPIFVTEGSGVREPIESLPGVERFSLDTLPGEVRVIAGLDIPAIILFGLPAEKDAIGSGADDPDGIIQRAIRVCKDTAPDLVVIADTCLCEYTSHGHCGIVDSSGNLLNDPSLERLAAVAVSQANAGADLIAPSAMLDGQVHAIREALDQAGHADIPILAYAAKFASAFYGPFRDAAGSAPAFGDRRAYQMDPGSARMAMREIEADLAEGADLVMVKPALAYLDVIRQARGRVDVPVVAYNVSGEYAMIKAAGRLGWIDERAAALEALTAIRRAGADAIITYFAKDAARWLAGAWE